jgi:hypothetical protein
VKKLDDSGALAMKLYIFGMDPSIRIMGFSEVF